MAEDGASNDALLFCSKGKIKIGQIDRYVIEYEPVPSHVRECLWLRVHNQELAPLRAAYLNGPFTLYVDMRPAAYEEQLEATSPADIPKYDNNVRAGQHFDAELFLKKGRRHRWTVDVIGEQLFSKSAEVHYDIRIGTSKQATLSKHTTQDRWCKDFSVSFLDTATLWKYPLPRSDKPLHLCVLTHGFVSNVTADLHYLKEEIDKAAERTGENLICRGYVGNVTKTEQGVKRLGRRLADWLMFELIPTYKPQKMSFVGHSLGGLVQSYALGYIEVISPGYFKNIELVNFVAVATPFLGISSENPAYVKFALDVGVAGKSGRDLGLSWQFGAEKPLLETLPTGPTDFVLKQFHHRTLYANAVNDGIVPLRTGSLLYLDWRALSKAAAAQHGSNAANFITQGPASKDHDHGKVSEAPQDRHQRRQKEGPFAAEESHHEPDSPISNFFSNAFQNPFIKKREKILNETQTISPHSSGSDGEEDGKRHHYRYHLLKKTSLIESGIKLLYPPHPSERFIVHPETRDDVIFHDRVYHEDDLPPRRYKTTVSFGKPDGLKEVAFAEERMARAWHHEKPWRKVLVQLLPEAHNNIIVRRRFSNAYGWPVIHHLVRNHFEGQTTEGEENDGDVDEVSSQSISDREAVQDDTKGEKSDTIKDSEADQQARQESAQDSSGKTAPSNTHYQPEILNTETNDRTSPDAHNGSNGDTGGPWDVSSSSPSSLSLDDPPVHVQEDDISSYDHDIKVYFHPSATQSVQSSPSSVKAAMLET